MTFLSGETGENVMSRVVRGNVKDPVIALLYLHIPRLKIFFAHFLLSSTSLVIKNPVQVRKYILFCKCWSAKMQITVIICENTNVRLIIKIFIRFS